MTKTEAIVPSIYSLKYILIIGIINILLLFLSHIKQYNITYKYYKLKSIILVHNIILLTKS